MSARHAPATPLPFEVFAESFIRSRGEVFTAASWSDEDDGISEKETKQNIAYLAHAANAYPALVEQLRTLNFHLKSRVRAILDRSGKPISDGIDALLRELGEGE